MSLQTVQSSQVLPLVERMRASRTSINPLTHLATDFLNQFNEVAMALDMLADWPDMFEELRHWHFSAMRIIFAALALPMQTRSSMPIGLHRR
jgi:hypothetical protein